MNLPPRPDRRRRRVLPVLLLSLGLLPSSASGPVPALAAPVAGSRSVRGEIRDLNGFPVPDARVALAGLFEAGACADLFIGSEDNPAIALRLDGEGGVSVPVAATLGPDGRFRATPGDASQYSALLALATAPGHAAALAQADREGRVGLALAPGCRASIQVLTLRDEPLDRATVTLVPLDVCPEAIASFPEQLILRGTSGPDGRVEFRDLAEGTFALHVAAAGREAAAVPLVLRRGRASFRVRMPRGATLKGAIQLPDGHPPAEVHVRAVWKKGARIGWTESPVQAGSNEFTIAGLPDSTEVNLFAWTDGGLRAVPQFLRKFPPSRDDIAATLRLAPARTLRGRLTGTRRPRALQVALAYPDDVPRSVRTMGRRVAVEADGRFVLEDVPPGVAQLRLSARGLGHLDLPVDESGERSLGLLALPPLTRSTPGPGATPPIEVLTLSGRDRRPADLLRVEIAGPPGQDRGAAQASTLTLYARTANGRLRLRSGDPEDLRLAVAHAEGGPASSVVIDRRAARSGARPVLEVPDLLSLQGLTITAVKDGPIQGAEVEAGLESGAFASHRLSWLTQSGESGAWSLPGLPAGTYDLKATAPGFVAAVKHAVSLAEETKDLSHRLVLVSPGGIRGRVLGLREGDRATVQCIHYMTTGLEDREAEVNAAGEFSLEDLEPATYGVNLYVTQEASRPWTMRSASVEVRAREIRNVEFDLVARVRVAGRVFIGEHPAPDVSLNFGMTTGEIRGIESSRADAEGHYQIDLPGAGTYGVSMFDSWAEGRQRRGRLTVEISKAESQTMDLRFPAGGIGGRVIDAGGRTLAEADVFIWRKTDQDEGEPGRDRERVADLWTRADGAFEAGALRPGRYWVQVEKKGYATALAGPIDLDRDGTSSAGDIVLRHGMPLTVRLLGPENAPLHGAKVVAIRLPDKISAAEGSRSDESGIALIEDLPEGRYMLIGWIPGLAPGVLENVSVESGDEARPRNLHLGHGGTLDIQVVGNGGLPVQAIEPTIYHESGINFSYFHMSEDADGQAWPSFTDTEGRLVIRHVRPGRYRVGLSGRKDVTPQTALVTETAQTRVILVAPK